MNENELYKSIRKRISSIRKDRGMTQEVLANKLGVTAMWRMEQALYP